MSKYDQPFYSTFSEKEKNILPECVTIENDQSDKVPDELLHLSVDLFRKALNLKSQKEKNDFDFINNNQYVINQNYFKNCKLLNKNMSSSDKKDYFLDYLKYHFGDRIDGGNFKLYLEKVFGLEKYGLTVENYNEMIKTFFKKNSIDLNNQEDRNNFKLIIYGEEIKLVPIKEEMII